MSAIGIIDNEDLRTRSLTNIYGGVNLAPIANTVAPQGISHLSSIGPANNIEIPQHRPVLSSPRKNVMIDVLAAHMETERLTAKAANVFDADLSKSLADIQKLSIEKEEALENEAKASKSRDTWSALSIIAQYVASVGLVVVGSACGGLPAALLIGAGVVGIGNRVLHDTHFLQAAVSWWTKSIELQQKITHNIEMGAFFLQMGLGLAGGVWAIQAGALAAAHSATFLGITQKTASIITAASSVAGAGAKVGAEVYKKRISDLEARLKEISAQITTDNHTMTQDTTKMSRMIESTQFEGEEIRKAIQTLQVSPD